MAAASATGSWRRSAGRLAGLVTVAAALLPSSLGAGPAPHTRPAARLGPALRAALRMASRPALRQHPAPAAARPAPEPEDVTRARQAIILFLRSGIRQAYVGEQVSALPGRARESRQLVEHAGPGRERIEYLSPPGMRGEILLLDGGRLYRYIPGKSQILDGAAPSEELQKNLRLLLQGIRTGRVSVRAVGTQILAGQNADIIEVKPARPGARYRRLWIDQRTGVRLKTEDVNPQGVVISTTYFTSINLNPTIDPAGLRPASLPNVPHVPLFPMAPPLGSAAAAEQQTGYPVRQPTLPAGFQLNGVWVGGGPPGRQTVILRYTDGVNTFALFQRPLPPTPARPATPPARVVPRNGVAHWVAGGRAFVVIGPLRRETVDDIVRSLQ